MKYPLHLLKLIDVLKKLPGVGSKSAERFAFEMLTWSAEQINEMSDVIRKTPTQLQSCSICGCLTETQNCPFCQDVNQRKHSLCIVAYARDVFAIEATQEYNGLYHVLGGLLSPIDGLGPDCINIHTLIKRLEMQPIEEIVIALDSTLEGDATALYLKQILETFAIPVSRLAFGLPMGSSLNYVDGGTLARALSARSRF